MNNMYEILDKMKLLEGRGSKPDFLDLDRDGNKKEPMKKAAKEVDESVDESIDEASTGDYSAKKARAGKDIGKPGKQFAKIAADAAKRYGSKERGEKVAGAVLAKLRAKEDVNEASLRQIFNRNENDNNHTENAVLLAKHFGTPEEHQQAKDALAYRDSHGGYSSSDREGKKHIQTVGNLHKKYGHKIVAEADMEEGNDFTGARLAAIRAGKPTFTVAGKTYKVTGDTSDEKMMEKKEKTLWPGTPEYRAKFGEPGMKTGEKKRSSTGGEIEKTATGIKHTARAYDDEEETAKDDGAPKRRGRPKGTKRALGAKGPTGKSKLLNKGSIKEGDLEDVDSIEIVDKGEYDREGDMAREQLHTAADAARELHDILDSDENLPEWVQSKITKAVDYLDTARDYMKASDSEDQEMAERKLTKPEMSKREKYVKSMKKSKGDFEKRYGDRGEEVMYATATKMAKKKAEESKDEEEIEETTTSGSVATAPADAPKGKKGMVFGKGVYESKLEESYTSRLEQMLTEGMSVNMSQSEDGRKSLSVTATDDDAVKLAQILQLAGMPQGKDYQDVCPACGQSPCGCESLEEADLANAPDPVYADTEMINDQGEDLHKRKSTGQTTIPVIYRGQERQNSMAKVYEEVKEDAEKKLWDLYKRY